MIISILEPSKNTIQHKNTMDPSAETLEVQSTFTYEKQSFYWKLKKILNPPIYAALIAVPLALIPGIKDYVFTGSGSVFVNNLTAALTSMGSCVSPLINVILGSNLSEGFPQNADISW